MSVSDKYGPKTKVLRIDPHAYRILINHKGKDETISDVIRRLDREKASRASTTPPRT